MIVGHKKQIEIFRKTLSSGRLSHAYILAGLEGVGKKMFAINAAKSIMCEKGSFFSDCGCHHCVQIDSRSHPDFRIFSGDELNVENMRAMGEVAAMTPLSAKWKIFILDKAEILSTSQVVAGNALLKSLEEPGENSLFFLITSRYDQVMPTIRSRSNVLKFSPLRFEEVKEILQTLRPDENFPDRAAVASGGSVSKALRILDGNIIRAIDFLEAKEYKQFVAAFAAVKDKDDLKIAAEFAYIKALDKFKKSGGVYKFYLLGSYMLEILKRLQYNVNIDLIKADFLSANIEADR